MINTVINMNKQRLTTISIDRKCLEQIHILSKNEDRTRMKYLHRLIDKEYKKFQELNKLIINKEAYKK